MGEAPRTVRFATFNASLNRTFEGELADNLSAPYDGTDPASSIEARRRWQAANVAEVIQRTRPDVLLINEFDYDAAGAALAGFQENYLGVSQNGADPIVYPYTFNAPSNTGVPSGVDLDNSGAVGGPNDAFGFGFFPGQFGMVVLSMYPIDHDGARTFQNFLWSDMPGNLIPTDFYSAEAIEVFRLSSKSHWDVPIEIPGPGPQTTTVHFLTSHPTPPVFDGPEDRNGKRNHDEIRFWADYVHPGRSGYIYDDDGNVGGLPGEARFVIAGDQNADPLDGDSVAAAIDQLLKHPKIADPAPTSLGGVEAAAQGGANDTHRGDPALDTADFADGAPGNLRVDYVLPSKRMQVADTAVFWPPLDDDLSRLTGVFDFGQFLQDGIGYPTSDHRMVWADIRVH
ncbi:MAG: endonuclease/exonuclease/phosphatase family protein [Acidimicrobiia bacterium]|nr:endonuclease/exonuclease/phosphatase family protein [Acidimicrobiia bacterium]